MYTNRDIKQTVDTFKRLLRTFIASLHSYPQYLTFTELYAFDNVLDSPAALVAGGPRNA